MTDIDALVNAWILDKFLRGNIWGYPAYDPKVHGPEEGVSVLSADTSWECGCYSEYTRDDDFTLVGKIQVWNVNGYPPTEINYRYGGWYDMPDFFEELDTFRDTWECSVETYEERFE